jgi:uncharacterized protein (DUF2249 family)
VHDSLPRFKDSAVSASQSACVSAHSTVFDVRPLPFWHRLPAVLQALDQLPPGDAIELLVELDPWPLRQYLEATRRAAFEWQYVEYGPPTWRVRISRPAG